jgi:hypothetical protein
MGAQAPQGRRGGCGAATAARRRRRAGGPGAKTQTGAPRSERKPSPARALNSGLFRDFDDDGMALDHALNPHEQYSVSGSEAPE